jgi:ferrous iron transport protein B
MPTLYSLGLRLIDRARIFLRQAGTIISASRSRSGCSRICPSSTPPAGRLLRAPQLADSVIGRLGHFIEPAIAPLGFNWKIGIGLLSSVLAREVMVSTMGTLYGADPSTQAMHLQTALHHDMTLGGALALMIFFAFAMQCTSTMAVVRRETNSWKWPAVQFLYMLALAYGAAFAVNHIVKVSSPATPPRHNRISSHLRTSRSVRPRRPSRLQVCVFLRPWRRIYPTPQADFCSALLTSR